MQQNTEIVIHETDRKLSPELSLSRDKVELWKRTYFSGASDDEVELFLNVCKRTRLTPETRMIYAVKRWDAKERREKMTVQFSIDGFRAVAERTGQYDGSDVEYLDENNKWVEFQPNIDPSKIQVKVTVRRKDFSQPIAVVGAYSTYVQTTKQGSPTSMWAKMPFLMTSKCVEALALRKAFPDQLSGLYTDDEMQQADQPPIKIQQKEEVEEDIENLVLGMLDAYAAIGVTRPKIEDYLHKTADDITKADLETLRALYIKIKNGSADVNQVFDKRSVTDKIKDID